MRCYPRPSKKGTIKRPEGTKCCQGYEATWTHTLLSYTSSSLYLLSLLMAEAMSDSISRYLPPPHLPFANNKCSSLWNSHSRWEAISPAKGTDRDENNREDPNNLPVWEYREVDGSGHLPACLPPGWGAAVITRASMAQGSSTASWTPLGSGVSGVCWIVCQFCHLRAVWPWSKWLNLSGPWFPHLQNRDGNGIYPIGL